MAGRGVVVVQGLDGLWLDARDTSFWNGQGSLSFDVKGELSDTIACCESRRGSFRAGAASLVLAGAPTCIWVSSELHRLVWFMS